MFVFVSSFVMSIVVCVFFFKQKTAYEMRISDWSSDVCSSDLDLDALAIGHGEVHVVAGGTLHWLLRSMDGEPPSLPFGWRIGMRCGVRWWQGKAAARRRGRIASDGRTFAMAAKVLLTDRKSVV